MKYEFDCIKNMELVESYEKKFQSKQTTSLNFLLPVMFD